MSRVEHLAEGVTHCDPTRWITIYALCEPIDKWKTGEIRYIGKTVNSAWSRVSAHVRHAKRENPHLPVHRWLKKQVAAGNPIHIRHLEKIPPGMDWVAREQYWIKKIKDEGNHLLNLTVGGEGLSGHKFSIEHKRKIADANKTGSEKGCQTCGSLFWRKRRDIIAGNDKFCSRACYAESRRGVSRKIDDWITVKGIAAAREKRKSQMMCKRGHLYSEHSFITSSGSRGCKECRKIHKTTYRAKGGK